MTSQIVEITTLFSDEFSRPLNSAYWDYNHWQSGSSNPSFYGRTQQRQSLPVVSNGILHLELDTYNPTNGYEPSFYGSEIITKKTFSNDTGGVSFEIKAHLVNPVGGIVGGMFSYNTNSHSLHDEIDFEILSNKLDQIQTNVYENEPLGAGHSQFNPISGTSTADHIYRIEWFKDAILWYVDDQLIREETTYIPEHSMAFHLNIWAPAIDWVEAYSGALNPVIDENNNIPYYFDVDWVHITQLSSAYYYNVTAPVVTSFNPVDDGIRVPVGSNLVITFSEPVQLGTTPITLRTSSGTVIETYSLGSSNVTISGNILTINPTNDLPNSLSYSLEIAAGAIKDLSGNSYAGSTSYNFTTVGLTSSEAILERAYIAYFGRPAEPLGFNWWLSTVSSQGGIDAVMTNVYRDFSKSDEYLRAYASDLDPVTHEVINTSHLLNTIYQNLFHRNIEQGGLDYWGSLVSQGTVTIDTVVLEVLNGARNADFDAINSKVDATIALTEKVEQINASGYSGDNAAHVAHDWLSGIYDLATRDAALFDTALTAAAEQIIDAGMYSLVSLIGVISPDFCY